MIIPHDSDFRALLATVIEEHSPGVLGVLKPVTYRGNTYRSRGFQRRVERDHRERLGELRRNGPRRLHRRANRRRSRRLRGESRLNCLEAKGCGRLNRQHTGMDMRPLRLGRRLTGRRFLVAHAGVTVRLVLLEPDLQH